MEKSDLHSTETAVAANHSLEKGVINLKKIQQTNIGNKNNNNINNQNKRNSSSSSIVSVSKLNVNYLNSLTSNKTNNININSNILPDEANNNHNNRVIIKEKSFNFGKMNKSINNRNNLTDLNNKNSPFQFIKAQLANKHLEILYRPKNFKAGIVPMENNFTSIPLEKNKYKNLNQSLNLSSIDLVKTKQTSSIVSPINMNNSNANNSVKKNKSNQQTTNYDSKSMAFNSNNQNEMISNSLTKLDYVKSMILNTTSISRLNIINKDNENIKPIKTNTQKLESLYQNLPSLLPYLNRRYDNEYNDFSNQPSFYLNYKQSASAFFHNNDLEGLSYNKGFKVNTAAPKNWLKSKYLGSKPDSTLDYISNTKTNFLVTNQS